MIDVIYFLCAPLSMYGEFTHDSRQDKAIRDNFLDE